MKERRYKGLCYYCDAKWNLGHKCQNPRLYLLEDVLLETELDVSCDEEQCERIGETQTTERIDTISRLWRSLQMSCKGPLFLQSWTWDRVNTKSELNQMTCQKQHVGRIKVTTSSYLCPLGWLIPRPPSKILWMRYSKPIWENFILVFFNNILVYGKTMKEHVEHIQTTL